MEVKREECSLDMDKFAGLLAGQLRRAAVPVPRQVDVLRRLGLRFPPGLEAEILAAGEPYEASPYAALLARLGRERGSGVLALEMEAADPDGMYAALLERLEALSGGEAAFRDVEEGPAPGGKRRVAFTLNGSPCRYEAEELGLWLDLGLFTALNGALALLEVKKRFVTVDDLRLQAPLVFYRTPEWTGFFNAGTGLAAGVA